MTTIQTLCEGIGMTGFERFATLGISTVTDLMQIDVLTDLPLLEQRGITYMDIKKLKNAAETAAKTMANQTTPAPTVTTAASVEVQPSEPPAEFAEKFASIAKGCYCWRILDQIKADLSVVECVLVVTSEFLLICSTKGDIVHVMRCQDVELAAYQEAGASTAAVLAIKAYERCADPTTVLSLRLDARNPLNDPMHPIHALNFIRKKATHDDLSIVKVPSAMPVHDLPALQGTFEEPKNYITPHMKFQILHQTKSWPNSGSAEPVQQFEYVFTGADGVVSTVRLGKGLGKDFGSAGKFQWLVDGKAKMPDIREVRYENGALRFRKNDNNMFPSLPADEAQKTLCLKSIASLASRARVRCTGLPKEGKKKKKEADSFSFVDADNNAHKVVPVKAGLEWHQKDNHQTVASLTYSRGVVHGGTAGPTAKVTDAAVLARLEQICAECNVTCIGFPSESDRDRSASASGRHSATSTGSYRHNPYSMEGADAERTPLSPTANGGCDTPNAPPSLASSRNASPTNLDEDIDMSGCVIMQPGEDGLPAYAPRGSFAQRTAQSTAQAFFFANTTPTPPPPLGTPIQTPPVPFRSSPMSPVGQGYTGNAGSGTAVPAAAVPASAEVDSRKRRVVVVFKHGRRGEFASMVAVVPGDHVVVETCYGPTIGVVVGEGSAVVGDEVFVVQRTPLPQEVVMWRELAVQEQATLPVVADLAVRSQTGIVVHRCEYLLDQSRLLLHCSQLPHQVLAQLCQSFTTLLGCRVLINNCLPQIQLGEVGEPIDTTTPHLPVPTVH